MSEYTKGPWTIETPCGFPYSGLYVVPVVRKDFPCHIAQIRQLREREESEANAHLIAAAPNLLEALNHIADECFDAMEGAGLPEFQFYEHWHTIAKAAISKAKKE